MSPWNKMSTHPQKIWLLNILFMYLYCSPSLFLHKPESMACSFFKGYTYLCGTINFLSKMSFDLDNTKRRQKHPLTWHFQYFLTQKKKNYVATNIYLVFLFFFLFISSTKCRNEKHLKEGRRKETCIAILRLLWQFWYKIFDTKF